VSFNANESSVVASVSIKAIVAAVAGNALEYYDFTTYAFFATAIGHTFFPTTSDATSLLLSLATFGVGFITRPLGGLLIGQFGDRAGRKPALIVTFALMTVGTIVMAMTPSYASIGIAAPLIVILARLIQGLAFGGESGPANAYVIELAPPARRGFYASWLLASQGVAVIIAGSMGVLLSAALSPESLNNWGWRIPFFVGLAIIPVGIYIRARLPETGHVVSAKNALPMTALFRSHWKLLSICSCVLATLSVSVYAASYMTTYALHTLKLPSTVAFSATLVNGVCAVPSAMLAGVLVDRYGRKVVMIVPRIVSIFVVIPVFLLLIRHPSVTTLAIATGTITVCFAVSSVALLTLLPELLPRNARSTGVALVFALGTALLGGSTQFVITWLIEATGDPFSPAYYLMVTGILGLVCMLMLHETRDAHMD
jgi:MFS family permease